jgi:hypothetical protein
MSHFCSRLRTVWPIEAHDSGHDDNRPRARDSEPKGTRSGLVHPVVPPYSPGYSASTRMWVRARHTICRRARRLRAPGSGSPGRRLNRAFFSCGKTCVHRPGRSADCPCPVRAQPAGCPASTGCWLNPGAVARYYGFQFSISNSVWILRFRAPLSVGEFRKTRHPRSVEFNKINETCFSGAGNSRFPEAWSL